MENIIWKIKFEKSCSFTYGVHLHSEYALGKRRKKFNHDFDEYDDTGFSETPCSAPHVPHLLASIQYEDRR